MGEYRFQVHISRVATFFAECCIFPLCAITITPVLVHFTPHRRWLLILSQHVLLSKAPLRFLPLFAITTVLVHFCLQHTSAQLFSRAAYSEPYGIRDLCSASQKKK